MQLGRIRLGQNDTWWPGDAQKAIVDYDALLGRLALISNENVRNEILTWIGSSNLPGAPAERYNAVSEALRAGAKADAMLKAKVDQLRVAVASLDAKVNSAEQAYGTLSAATAAGSTSEADVRELVVAGSIALLGLIVLPLILD